MIHDSPKPSASRRRTSIEPRTLGQTARADDTVRCLLEATARVICEVGWHRLSTNKVAKVAGVSIGALYRYFPNREALARGLVHQLWNEEANAMGTAVSAHDPSTPPFEHLTRSYVRLIAARTKLYAEWSTHLVQLVAEDAAQWDEKVLDLLVGIFDVHYEDHPRKRAMCEVVFASVVLVARRAASASPELLADGTIENELCAIVNGSLAAFQRRSMVSGFPAAAEPELRSA